MTPFAIPFPPLSPELFSIEIGGFAFALRWYALAYLAGLVLAWWMAVQWVKRVALWPNDTPPMTAAQVEEIMTWMVIGVVIGGRLGFVLFYQPAYYLQNPAEILMVWQGGMAFHGGFLGVVIAAWAFAWRNGLPVASVADLVAIVVPPGLFFGRIANFINAELWGRPTDAPWGVIFPGEYAQACATLAEPCARHPSQLYEAILEGLLLLAVLVWLAARRSAFKHPWRITGWFMAGYGAARTFVETFRQTDAQFITADNPAGHVIRMGEFGLTQGQLLSVPMLLIGLGLIAYSYRK